MPGHTTPQKKVTTGKPRMNHHSLEVDPPYWGDPEMLKSGGAAMDCVEWISPAEHVSQNVAENIDMDETFVAGHDGSWPDEDEDDRRKEY